jgi:hypothetical protein
MSNKAKTLFSLTLLAALAGGTIMASWPAGAQMQTVTTTTQAPTVTTTKDTFITQQDVPGTQKVNFSDFDANKDGTLSRNEVGGKLFYIFDTDGNQVIDNIEYTRPMVLTIIPMEKKEITTIDFNDDGVADSTSYSQEEFFEQSKLARFDQNKNGLSAREFLDRRVYWNLDDNKDKTVDIKEWKRAYIASLQPSAANPNRYNQ